VKVLAGQAVGWKLLLAIWKLAERQSVLCCIKDKICGPFFAKAAVTGTAYPFPYDCGGLFGRKPVGGFF
jgi:hypothetical protein